MHKELTTVTPQNASKCRCIGRTTRTSNPATTEYLTRRCLHHWLHLPPSSLIKLCSSPSVRLAGGIQSLSHSLSSTIFYLPRFPASYLISYANQPFVLLCGSFFMLLFHGARINCVLSFNILFHIFGCQNIFFTERALKRNGILISQQISPVLLFLYFQ